jgi:tRNA(His) 5'-end guanylyltransferase
LRKQEKSVQQATSQLKDLSVADKNELLFQNGINFNDLPAWQKRGVGFYWEKFGKEAKNPQTGETVFAERRRIKTELQLPMRDEYNEFIKNLLLLSV